MTLVIFKYKKPHHHHAQLRPVAHINLAHYLLLVNFTLWCSNIAEIRPCDESISVKSCAETLSPLLETSDKIRLVLISSCSNQTITFVPESLIMAETYNAVLVFMSLYTVHDAGYRPESRKQWRYHGEQLYMKFNETHLYLKTFISSK